MAKSENVAIFNPLVLSLPNWHPDGPDGEIDGFVIPFVFPDDRQSGRKPNRGARIGVHPTDHGWRAALRNCQDHAETAAQARAFAAAWIRAAEILDNVTKPKPAGDGIVDAVIVEDEDEHQGDNPADGSCASCGARVDHEHAPDCATYLVQLRGGVQ